MTLPPEVTGRKLDRNSAISLGLAIAMSAGALAFAARIPTGNDTKVIVNDAMLIHVKPLEVQVTGLRVEMAEMRGEMMLIKQQMKSKDGG